MAVFSLLRVHGRVTDGQLEGIISTAAEVEPLQREALKRGACSILATTTPVQEVHVSSGQAPGNKPPAEDDFEFISILQALHGHGG